MPNVCTILQKSDVLWRPLSSETLACPKTSQSYPKSSIIRQFARTLKGDSLYVKIRQNENKTICDNAFVFIVMKIYFLSIYKQCHLKD